MGKKIIIIGSGMAGLSTGCYAQMNGYDSAVFEQHSTPGGLCTSWKRGDYVFDGCIHWLLGSAEGNSLNRYWNEIGALQNKKFVYHDELTRIETGPSNNRKTFIVYSNADRLKEHMKAIAPEDTEEIEKFAGLIKKFADFDVSFDKPFELLRMSDFVQIMKSMKPFWSDYKALRTMTIGDYAKKFKNGHLRQGIEEIINMPSFSFFALLLLLSWQHKRVAGYPIGGSRNFIMPIERKYLELGGTISYSKRVSKILVRGKKAIGVALDDGSEHFSDIVVSAADGYTTIFKMLSGRFINRAIKKNYDDLPVFDPFFCLSLGVKRDFSKEPPLWVRYLRSPIHIEGRTQNRIGIKHYCFDPTIAPAGKSVLQIMYTSDYQYWSKLKINQGAYDEEKKSTAGKLIHALEEFYPGIGDDIEVMDAATPVTYERYTGNRYGSYEGWLLTPKALTMRMKKRLPGLKDFYMAGQWVQPGGGLPSAMKSGRDLVYLICNKDGKTFRHS